MAVTYSRLLLRRLVSALGNVALSGNSMHPGVSWKTPRHFLENTAYTKKKSGECTMRSSHNVYRLTVVLYFAQFDRIF